MSPHTDGSAAIIERMRELRSTGLRDVNRLHAQVGRVTDWREHVRAHPEVVFIAASVLGFSMVRKLANSSSSAQHIIYTPQGVYKPQVSVAKPKSATSGLVSVIGGMAVSAGRKWLTEYFKKELRARMRAAVQSTDTEQRSHSNL